MPRSELDGDVWTIPAARYKSSHKTNQDVTLPLSKLALQILAATPVTGKRWTFSNDGTKPLSNSSRAKRDFDRDAGLSGWVVHDLRRTARSLMSRAGVPPRHAEMALGHVIEGVEGTYDRHEYLDEKRAAFESLAGLLDRILKPVHNVRQMKKVA